MPDRLSTATRDAKPAHIFFDIGEMSTYFFLNLKRNPDLLLVPAPKDRGRIERCIHLKPKR
jgi:hypothetical protein